MAVSLIQRPGGTKFLDKENHPLDSWRRDNGLATALRRLATNLPPIEYIQKCDKMELPCTFGAPTTMNDP